MPTPWSREEVESIVEDYLHMLTQELAGQSYNKSRHREALKNRLRQRSDGSIERKHQNISAVLIELGCPFISGYKPLPNYQRLLAEVVEARVAADELFNRTALSAAEQPAAAPLEPSFEDVLVPPPVLRHRVGEPPVAKYTARLSGIKRDYLDREARNRSLGMAGEVFVVAFERARLWRLGRSTLSDRVEHVSRTKGDGLGFDVLSFEPDGRERFIEVKTTSFGKETPFFVSRNEADFSDAFPAQFHLYRVFEFRRAPKMFDLDGALRNRCVLDPATYRASFV